MFFKSNLNQVVLAQAFNLSTWKAERQVNLCDSIQDSQGYTENPVSKNKTKQNSEFNGYLFYRDSSEVIMRMCSCVCLQSYFKIFLKNNLKFNNYQKHATSPIQIEIIIF